MKYFSMFSGIGGFEIGIEKGYNNNKYESKKPRQTNSKSRGKRNIDKQGKRIRITDNPPLCIGFSEIDKYAIQIYKQHFPKHKNFGNARDINPKELPDFDMLCGGFPCQSFSIAGKRKGFQDTRGTLFYEICRIVAAKRPRLLFLENVKGLLSADDGRCFATILTSLDELGYDVEWQVLNSKNFGVPQNRERVFIIGHLREESSRQVFPLGESDENIGEERRIIKMGKGKHQQDCIINPEGIAPAVNSYESHGCGYSHNNPILHKPIEIGTFRTYNDGKGFRKMKEEISPGIPARAREDGSGQPAIKIQNKIRRLTPIECERLQGFPDGWTEGISDTQRYKCLGNAVTVNVIEAVAESIVKSSIGNEGVQC